MLKLKSVNAGDTIGLFASGSPVDPVLVEKGLETVRALGFRYKLPSDPSQNFGRTDRSFGSASIEERVQAIHSLLNDPEVSCLLGIRAGYGTAELLPHLDFELMAQMRKPIIGYSDICTLLLATKAVVDLPVIHGPMIAAEFARYSEVNEAKQSVDSLFQLLRGEPEQRSYRLEVLRGGEGDGWLLPVNVTILDTLVGTPWELSLDGAILVLEDITMMPYRIHRILLHMKQSGRLRGIKGVVFGRFHHCIAKWGPELGPILEASAEEIFNETSCPILRGLPFGHEGENQPLALGVRARIRGELFEILESPFEE